nr:uncharacterized protein LOC112009054 [Quercus suber]
MEKLVKKWGNMSLDDREGGEVQLNATESSKKVTVAAKFLTKRALSIEAVIRTFNPIWRPKNGFKVRNVGNHIILFIFDNEEEVEKIMKGEPWSFDKHLVVLKRYDYSIPVQDLVFEHVSLWVQVHDIPIKYLSREIAENLCEAAGIVSKEPILAEVDRGNVMRIRVRVDITLPLCRGRIFTLENGTKGWASFKYERLPNVCYWCGRLDHFDKDCDRWIQSSGTLTKKEQEYGSWLCASPLPTVHNSLVIVPGYYEAKKKEIEMRVDQRKKGNTSGQVNSDTAAQKVTQGGGLMEDRTSEINEPITREEDVMEVTQPRATTGENSESLQLEREAENQGDYFEEKINEIDSDLMKFELKKDSGNGCAVNKETAVDLEGETENSGEMLNILPRGLEASEKFKENKKHVTEEEENPKVNATLVLGETKEAMASSFPTWKRIVRKETGIIRIATPLRTLKRSSAELVEAELPRKKKQVSQDVQKTTSELARAGNQSRQEP